MTVPQFVSNCNLEQERPLWSKSNDSPKFICSIKIRSLIYSNAWRSLVASFAQKLNILKLIEEIYQKPKTIFKNRLKQSKITNREIGKLIRDALIWRKKSFHQKRENGKSILDFVFFWTQSRITGRGFFWRWVKLFSDG